MAKKEAPAQGAELSQNQQRRLDELAEAWDTKSSYSLYLLTAADLRLLLEHFEPLRDLIRRIAASFPKSAARETTESAHSGAEAASNAELEAQLHKLKEQLAAACAENEQLRHIARRHAVLDALRAHPDLAESLRLGRLPDDPAEALAHVAAVLAQWNYIERLWEQLKERCNRAQRPATEAEITLLTQALAWHNLGYTTPLHELTAPAPGSPFDFNQHQRASRTASGERIQRPSGCPACASATALPSSKSR